MRGILQGANRTYFLSLTLSPETIFVPLSKKTQKKMKTENINNERIQSAFGSFMWVFNSGGVDFQSHNEAEYQAFLKANYESKTSTYQYLNSL